jgi:hypothetical protein
LNGTHQFLSYVDDINILGENIDEIKKSAEALLNDIKEVCLEVNRDKRKCILVSSYQKIGRT